MSANTDLVDLTNLGDIILAHADSDRPALVDLAQEPPVTYSYRDLALWSGGVVRMLAEAGLVPGDRVGIWALNRAEYVVAYFGIMRAGMVAVPFGVRLPQETVDFIVEDSSLRLVLTDRERVFRVPPHVPAVDFDDSGPDGFAARTTPGDEPTVEVDPNDEAEVLYTSGSTGRPKGVALSHAGQLWALRALGFENEGDPHRQIIAQPLFHMNGIVTISLAFLSGDVVHLQPRYIASDYVAAIDRYLIERISAVPTMWVRALRERESGRASLASVRELSLGSAPTSRELIAKTNQLCPDVVVSLSYGTTEAGPAVFGPHPDGIPKPPLALGFPLPDIDVELVRGSGPDDGVLLMRTAAIMDGYLNLPARTEQVVDDGWYDSGDVMRRDADGFYYFVGRADDMFVCGGENIYPVEVQSVIEDHPLVRHAVVVPLADDDLGAAPVAFVVRQENARVSAAELTRFVRDRAAPHLRPRRISFVDELPMAGTNKWDRAALIARARELEKIGGWDA